MGHEKILDELRRPFHPSRVTWKPGAVKGERALALAYADLRVYMDRLDEICGLDWQVEYLPWEGGRIICQLTINGFTRSSTGESTNESERSEIGGTVAEAQAFKRACAMFGLGRYLYNLPTVWVEFDPKTKQITDKGKAKLAGILKSHYDRTLAPAQDLAQAPRQHGTQPAQNGNGDKVPADDPFTDAEPVNPDPISETTRKALHALGTELYGDQWEAVRHRNVRRVTEGRSSSSKDLTEEQAGKLITGMRKLRAQRTAKAAQAA